MPILDIRRRRALAVLGAASLAPGAVRAQAWPTRSVELVVPYPTGASVDFTARLVQPRLAAALGQSVVVENRGGAGGNIGSAYVAKSAPDGYRILLTTNAVMVINPHVYRNMGFDALKDLTPLTLAVNGPIGIAVAATSPIQSLADLIAFAKRDPGKLSFGTPGSGSPQHVVGELLKQRAGMFMVHIPYRGVGPVITDVIGGSVDVVISTLSALTPQAGAGRLRVLALCEAKRLESAPNIPVVAETLPGFEASAWLAFFAPAGTPREVVQKLNAALVGAINAEDVRSKLIGGALAPAPGTPEQLGKLVRDDHERWGRIIRERNITAD